MKKTVLLLLLTWSVLGFSATPGVYRADVKAPVEQAYQALYQSLEEARFWVVYEVNMGESLSGFAEKWGDEYNRNKLEAIRTMVVCNGWYANQVSNADPNLLALCPLRLSVIHKDGISSILFARPTAIAAGSPGLELVKEVEGQIIGAIDAAVKAASATHD